MVNTYGELIYVGKAKSLRARLMSYFRPRSRDPKAGHIVAQAQSILWEQATDEFAALHRELELIRRWRPKCNVQGQPGTLRHVYICLGRSPAPYAFVAARPSAGVLASFGPLPSAQKASEAVRRVNDLFQMRDCSQAQEMFFADQIELFPETRTAGCLRHELGTCLGPCAGACRRGDYNAQVRAAKAFLAGQDLSPLMRLHRSMQEASAQQQFERAAVLRDKFTALDWLNRQLELVRRAKGMGTMVYPFEGNDGVSRWYLLHGGRAVAVVVPAASWDPRPSGALASDLIGLARKKSRAGQPGDWVAGVFLVSAWFRKHPAERQMLVTLG
jgi:excinuclease ABC subunit C